MVFSSHDAAGSSGVGTSHEPLSDFAPRQLQVIIRPVVDEFRVCFQTEHIVSQCHTRWLAAHQSLADGDLDLIWSSTNVSLMNKRQSHEHSPLVIIDVFPRNDALWFKTDLIRRIPLLIPLKRNLVVKVERLSLCTVGAAMMVAAVVVRMVAKATMIMVETRFLSLCNRLLVFTLFLPSNAS